MKSHPGYYRIVNPYGKNTPIYGKINNYVLDSSADHYLYINAMDPEAVFMPIADLRMAEEWDDYGETSLTVMTKGYYNAIVDEYGYSSLEEQAELGHMGRLADGYITFPANEIYLSASAITVGVATTPISRVLSRLSFPERRTTASPTL